MKPGPENNFRAGHRERLLKKFLAGLCTDSEKLELLLMFAIPRRDVRPLARGLMCKYGGLHQVINTPIDQLIEYPGLGERSVGLLRLFNNIMESEYVEKMKNPEYFNDPKVIHGYCRTVLYNRPVEECRVLYLGAYKKLLHVEIHSRGTSDWSAIYPNEILKTALNLCARFVIMMHNHPSGEQGFSDEDVEITTEVMNLLAHSNIHLVDHFVLSGDVVQSMRETTALNQRADVTNNAAVTSVNDI